MQIEIKGLDKLQNTQPLMVELVKRNRDRTKCKREIDSSETV